MPPRFAQRGIMNHYTRYGLPCTIHRYERQIGESAWFSFRWFTFVFSRRRLAKKRLTWSQCGLWLQRRASKRRSSCATKRSTARTACSRCGGARRSTPRTSVRCTARATSTCSSRSPRASRRSTSPPTRPASSPRSTSSSSVSRAHRRRNGANGVCFGVLFCVILVIWIFFFLPKYRTLSETPPQSGWGRAKGDVANFVFCLV